MNSMQRSKGTIPVQKCFEKAVQLQQVKVRKLNKPYWKKFTKDQWILNIIEPGYKIEFFQQPFQTFFPKQIQFNAVESEMVSKEVKQLVDKGAIEEVKDISDAFISNIFLVPKKDGNLRPIINLKYLNEFVEYYHFKQENLTYALELIQKNDYLTSVDLKDAYFSVSVHPDYKKFLTFSWNGKFYRFVVLPFGLTSCPRIFTKILKPVYAFFRENGIRCCYYIDDSLIMNQTFSTCQEQTNIVMSELNNLGFTINDKKSITIPSQRIVFFGVIIDSVEFKVYLTDEKVEKILRQSQLILSNPRIQFRQLASLIGLLVHACNAVFERPLHYRTLERDKDQNLKLNNNDYNSVMTCSVESINEIKWCRNIQSLNGKDNNSKDQLIFVLKLMHPCKVGVLDLKQNDRR